MRTLILNGIMGMKENKRGGLPILRSARVREEKEDLAKRSEQEQPARSEGNRKRVLWKSSGGNISGQRWQSTEPTAVLRRVNRA